MLQECATGMIDGTIGAERSLKNKKKKTEFFFFLVYLQDILLVIIISCPLMSLFTHLHVVPNL